MIQAIKDPNFFQNALSTLLHSDIPVIRVIVIFILLHCIAHYVVLPFLDRKAEQLRSSRLQIITHHHLFRYTVLTLQGIVLTAQLSLVISPENKILDFILLGARLWVLTFALLAFYSFIDVGCELYKSSNKLSGLPYRGIEQSLKLTGAVVYAILLISLLLNKSPLILLSGLSAVAAVLLLVFKDPLLGLVAGIQLSANDMLRPGDWIELDQLGANGTVQDIGLTTVKVLNFDNTITTIPTYTLVSGAFKNWRYMIEHNARRFQRTINIDIKTIKYINPEEKQAITGNPSLPQLTEMESNAHTNVELFQQYACAYLRQHDAICQQMTLMVRQLQPTVYGLPVEFYAFTSFTEWMAYEQLQTEIMSYLISIVPFFNLKIHDVS
ncbi:mechanosensitive ion channel family protein [Enterobacter pseudoroggenkampii]|jgi:miniconductance mechanosensitive channel|uniref:Mechanosensitive ion channel n=1 Tax=Enterobacter pseudoroggenkampii TaxID=2996112 RepID=A0ABT3XIJ7_9ENTR|nr:mechanosensitive ion channel domain-containing protein [Enterobacter pseudoroggenkampii]MCX8304733.1 mechanosensitive ion channel [Enterobacter pseudoroggenkampii]